MPTVVARVTLAALAIGALGCPSVTTLHSADPVAPRHWELALAVDGTILRDVPQDTRAPAAGALVAARYGLTENLDVGVRIYTLGADLSARWRLWRGAWRGAILPSIGAARTTESSTTTNAVYPFVQLPLVVTTDVSRALQWSFGPRMVLGWYVPDTGGTSRGLMLGAFTNLGIALSPRWSLVPEVSVHRTVVGDVPIDGVMAQFALGVRVRP